MAEDGETKTRGGRDARCLCFFLGVMLAASIGLAIALAVTLLDSEDDDDGSSGVTQGTSQPPSTERVSGICITESCVLRGGELLQRMDKAVDPCQDFYQYSCGKWLSTHSISESQSSVSTWSELIDTVALELKGLLEKPYDSDKESDYIRKAKNMYQSCMDEESLDKKGAQPLRELAQQVGMWPLTSSPPNASTLQFDLDLESTLGKLNLLGSYPLIDVSVYQDDQNSSQYIPWIEQPGLGMDRAYFLLGRNSTVVMTYAELLRQRAVHVLGVTSSDDLVADISDVVDFEIQLAEMSASSTELRDISQFYQKMTIAELSTAVPTFNWTKYLTTVFDAANVSLTDSTEVVLMAEDYLTSMLDLFNSTDQRIVANYLLMRLVGGYAEYLSKDLRELNQDLRMVLYGITESYARWGTCVDDMDDYYMPTAVGQMYVSTYFSSNAKRKADEMIAQIRQAMKQMIRDVTWMDQETKDKALEKADAIRELIGYPEYQFNETRLTMLYQYVDYQPDNYFQNGLEYSRSSVIENARLLLQTPDREEWFTSASTVNAYYSPWDNSIIFPAGILQPPYYAEDFLASLMFGGMGTIIGHEITHGFDDQGRDYDKDGNNREWWSQSSSDNYDQLAACYVDQYGQQEVAGIYVNGNLTLGENIADNGGLKAAFKAFQRWQSLNGAQPVLPGLGLTQQQLFFVNFAQGWCTWQTDESLINQMLSYPHAPDSVRVLVPVSNSEDFAKAFNCPTGSPMNPREKCVLW